MGLKPKFSIDDVRRKLEDDAKKIESVIILRLAQLGEKCVNYARALNTYTDQTGNLRASIGYVIVKDGKVVRKNFSPAQTGQNAGGASEGLNSGQGLALQLAGDYSKGFALIVVAGMNYAVYVEAKGYDVLSSAELHARQEFPRMVRVLAEQITYRKKPK